MPFTRLQPEQALPKGSSSQGNRVCCMQDHTSPTAPEIQYPQSHSQFCSRNPAVVSLSALTHAQQITKTFSSNLSSLNSFHYLSFQHQMTFVWDTTARQNSKTGKLTQNHHHSLFPYKSNPQSHSQCCNGTAAFLSLTPFTSPLTPQSISF